MSKYLIRFTKEGMLRFISHLDLMRLFQRTFKRADIALVHSQGFNPHPKMSFAHPLSLGFTSEAEYMEVELVRDQGPQDVMEKMNLLLPQGVRINGCRRAEEGKSGAALVEFGAYEIWWILPEGKEIGRKGADAFFGQKQILVEKAVKKKKGVKEVDIRPLIADFRSLGERDGVSRFYGVLATGSAANLNPMLLLQALGTSEGITPEGGKIRIHRTELYKVEKGKLKPLFE